MVEGDYMDNLRIKDTAIVTVPALGHNYVIVEVIKEGVC